MVTSPYEWNILEPGDQWQTKERTTENIIVSLFCQYLLYSWFHRSLKHIHSSSCRWYDDTFHYCDTSHKTGYNFGQTSHHRTLKVNNNIFDKVDINFANWSCFIIMQKKSRILLWSHWAFFHPVWHPSKQYPFTGSHIPELKQWMLQLCWQFCPNVLCGHSTLMRLFMFIHGSF